MDRKVEKVSKIYNQKGDRNDTFQDKKQSFQDRGFKSLLNNEQERLEKKNKLKDIRKEILNEYQEIENIYKKMK